METIGPQLHGCIRVCFSGTYISYFINFVLLTLHGFNINWKYFLRVGLKASLSSGTNWRQKIVIKCPLLEEKNMNLSRVVQKSSTCQVFSKANSYLQNTQKDTFYFRAEGIPSSAVISEVIWLFLQLFRRNFAF